MNTTLKMTKGEKGKSVDQHEYQTMIGSLLYLTVDRADIAYNVGMQARYQANTKKSHKKAVTCVLRYVNGRTDHGIFYSKRTTTHLVRYSYVDWVGIVMIEKAHEVDTSMLETT